MTDVTAGNSADVAESTSAADVESAALAELEGLDAPIDNSEDEDEAALNAIAETGETGEETSAEDESEEIEKDGKKYKIPKALKDEFLMRQAFSQKTADLAELKRAVLAERETEARALMEQRQAAVERIQGLREAYKQADITEAALGAYDEAIRQSYALARKAEDEGDWATRDAARAQAGEHQFNRQQIALELEQHRANVATKETELTSERARAAQAARQAAIEKGVQELAADKDIQLDADKFKAISTHGQQRYGFTDEEIIGAVPDPRMIRVLWDNHLQGQRIPALEAENASLKTQLAAFKRNPSPSAMPAKTTSGANAGRPQARADTSDFAAFEAMADKVLAKH